MDTNKIQINNQQTRMDSIQVIRGIAALAVFLGHAFWVPYGYNWGFGFGVDIFFCISGFIMMYVTQSDARNFFRKRMIRIVPVYWVSTFAYFFIFWIAKTFLSYGSMTSRDLTNPLNLLASLFFIPRNDVRNIINGNGWTLNYEMLFYMLFGVACMINIKYRALICAALLAVVSAFSVYFGLSYSPLLFAEFLCGFAAFYFIKWINNKSVPKIISDLCGVISVIMLAIMVRNYDFGVHRLFAVEPFAFIFFLSFVVFARSRKMPKAAVYLGDMSYSVYLWHVVVLNVVNGILVKFFNAPYIYRGPKIAVQGTVWGSVYVLLSILLTLLVSVISYELIEKRFTAFLRRKFVKS